MAQNPIRRFVSASAARARHLLLSRQERRKMMFVIMLAVMVQVFVGAVMLDGYLMRRPLLFVVFWGICFGGVVFAFLLAAYDLLVVRQEGRLRERILSEELRRTLQDEVDSRRRQKDDENP